MLPVLRSGGSVHAIIMLFILLTLARLNEAAGATWAEINLDQRTWTIPPERQKDTRGKRATQGRKPVVIPLNWEATTLLSWAKGDRDPEPQSLVFPSRQGTAFGNWDRAQKAILEASGTTGWHRHDLRRTSATMMDEAGVPPYVVEAPCDDPYAVGWSIQHRSIPRRR